jgi:type IV pilus assembly protein PilN
VILINLLPHREVKRRQRKQAFFVGLGLAALVGALAVGAWTMALNHLTQRQQDRNAYLRTEIKKLEDQIKDIANLRNEIESLKARQAAVEDLQLNRNVPVRLLDDLVKHTPEGIYLTAIRQTDSEVTVSGMAQTNERVSEFLRNAQAKLAWLDRLELVEIKAVTPPVATGNTAQRVEQRRLFEFALRLSVKTTSAPAAAAGAAPAASAVPRKAA